MLGKKKTEIVTNTFAATSLLIAALRADARAQVNSDEELVTAGGHRHIQTPGLGA